jgi:hypothetical protein
LTAVELDRTLPFANRRSSWREYFLYHTSLGDKLLQSLWERTAQEYADDAGVYTRPGRLPDFEDLHSKASMRWRTGYVGLIQRDDYWDVIAPKVRAVRGDMVAVEKAVIVQTKRPDHPDQIDGEKEVVKTEVLLCATGWVPTSTMFCDEEAARLGMPILLESEEVVDREIGYWESLDQEVSQSSHLALLLRSRGTVYESWDDRPLLRHFMTAIPWRFVGGDS